MSIRVGTAVVVAAAATGVASATAALPGRPNAPATATVLVRYTTDRRLAEALVDTHATLLRRLPALRVAELRVPAEAARILRHDPGVRYAGRPARRVAAAEPALADTSGAGIPLEWQYQAIDEAGVPASVLRAASSVRIAVIDTGADLSAPDIAAKAPAAYNTRTGTGDVSDTNGHGTFVASLAAGSVTNGEGIAGAGGDAQLLVVKSGSPTGAFTDMDEAAGIMYAVDHGARIINLSVGGPTTSVIERSAIQYAADHGVLVVAAAGNEYASGDPVEYPAALLQQPGSNGVGGIGLAVGASNQTGGRAAFSNTGSWISLAAPGENVLSDVSASSSPALYPRAQLPGSQTGLYGYASGTSFAAPQVAGAAALVWAANPSLTAGQVARILKETASGGGRWTPELGFGVIDVAAAVARAQDGGAGVLLAGARVKRGIHLTWNGDDAQAYTLSVSTDGRSAKTLLAATDQTSATLALPLGHTYSFTVVSLDGDGTQAAASAPLTFALAGVRSR